MNAVLATDFLASDRFNPVNDANPLGLFGSFSADTVQEFLDEAEDDICRMAASTVWGSRFLRAIKLLAAHRMVMNLNSQGGIAIAGSISNINVSNGSQSAGFGGGSSTPEDPEAFATTVFGREFEQLVKGLPISGFVVI